MKIESPCIKQCRITDEGHVRRMQQNQQRNRRMALLHSKGARNDNEATKDTETSKNNLKDE